MRTTVDLPDALMERVKLRTAEDGVTFRALVVSALESALETPSPPFTLRDASVGSAGSPLVDSATINNTIDSAREPGFTP